MLVIDEVFIIVAGTQPGGWMQRIKDDGMDPTKPVFSRGTPTTRSPQAIKVELIEEPMTKPGIDGKITAVELEAHQREGDPWFVVRGEVRLA
jgi:nitrate reductase (NAD(P)H)